MHHRFFRSKRKSHPIYAVRQYLMLGDSLTDRGSLDHRNALGFLPMRWLSGLSKTSPRGRFTNGYTWADYLISETIDEQEKKQMRQSNRSALTRSISMVFDAEMISDEIITQRYNNETGVFHQNVDDISDQVITGRLHPDYTLNDDKKAVFKGQLVARSYAEGGLTAYDYRRKITFHVAEEGARLSVATLAEKRALVLSNDRKYSVSPFEKATTLVIEWSGANDLITVNARPTVIEADRIIQERIQNLEALVASGYRQFVLTNMPDISLTPQYQEKSTAEQKSAQVIINYFNKKLATRIKALAKKYAHHCTIHLYDVNTVFTQLYHGQGVYAYDKTSINPGLLKKPYTQSRDFIITQNHTSPAPGYMFWDDVHPITEVHYLLANNLCDFLKEKGLLAELRQIPPSKWLHEKICLDIFKAQYHQEFIKSKQGCFGLFRRSRLYNIYREKDNLTLQDVFQHALEDGGHRTLKILKRLR